MGYHNKIFFKALLNKASQAAKYLNNATISSYVKKKLLLIVLTWDIKKSKKSCCPNIMLLFMVLAANFVIKSHTSFIFDSFQPLQNQMQRIKTTVNIFTPE